jgi:hypothetical protein
MSSLHELKTEMLNVKFAVIFSEGSMTTFQDDKMALYGHIILENVGELNLGGLKLKWRRLG